MRVTVDGAPPSKDQGMSSRGPTHLHFPRVELLRKAMLDQVDPSERLVKTAAVMHVHYERFSARSDALNLMNGIADVVQSRGNLDQPWIIDDDFFVTEFHYKETAADHDRYTVEISAR